jgi:hypothetical protein
MARRLDDPLVLLPALHARALGHVGPDVPLDERVEEAGELILLAAQLGDDEARYLGHMLRELALVEAGKRPEADLDLQAAEQVSGRLGIPSLQAWAVSARARQHWLDGRFAQAEAVNARALGLAAEKGGDPEATNLVLGGQLLSFQLLRNDLSPFVPAVQAFCAEFPHFTILRCFAAYAYCETGDRERARLELAEIGAQGFSDTPRNAEWPGTMWALSRVATSLGDTHAGAQLYAELAACSGRWLADWASICLGPVDTCLGMLAGLARAHDVAEAHFREAEEQARRASSPPWLADAQVHHAATLLQSGSPDARGRADALLSEALSSCEALGLEAVAVRGRALLS